MIVFPHMLVNAASNAGIKVPSNPDEPFDRNEFAHFAIFCSLQLKRPLTELDEHWRNAQVIAKIPQNKIRTVTLKYLIEVGFVGLIK